MGKRGKKEDVTETKGNPVIRALLGSKKEKVAPDRLAKDIEIVDKGWNNTAEGQADLTSGRKPGQPAKGSGRRRKN